MSAPSTVPTSVATAPYRSPPPWTRTKRKPLGGLPKPTLAVTRLTCDAQGKIFEPLVREFGIAYYPLENTVPQYLPERWWEKAPRQWEQLFEPHRLDLMVEELKGLIRFLETTTGRSFNETKFKKSWS